LPSKTGAKSTDTEQRVAELYRHIDQLMHHYTVIQSDSLDTPWGTLSHQECKVVKMLEQEGSCIMRQIAEPLGLALSTATGIVDRLVHKNLVHRERSDEDRRIVKVGLTDEGRAIYEADKKRFMDLCRGMLNSLTDREQISYLSLTQKIIKNG